MENSTSKKIELEPLTVKYFREVKPSKSMRDIIEDTFLEYFISMANENEFRDHGLENLLSLPKCKIVGWGEDYIELKPLSFKDLLSGEGKTLEPLDRLLGTLYHVPPSVAKRLADRIKHKISEDIFS